MSSESQWVSEPSFPPSPYKVKTGRTGYPENRVKCETIHNVNAKAGQPGLSSAFEHKCMEILGFVASFISFIVSIPMSSNQEVLLDKSFVCSLKSASRFPTTPFKTSPNLKPPLLP